MTFVPSAQVGILNPLHMPTDATSLEGACRGCLVAHVEARPLELDDKLWVAYLVRLVSVLRPKHTST